MQPLHHSTDDLSAPADQAIADRVRQTVERERHERFAELAPAMLVELSPQGIVRHVSPNVIAILGFSAEEIVGGSAFAQVHPEDLRLVQDSFFQRSGHVVCRHRHKDGSWRWLEMVRRDFIASDGVAQSLVVAHDITRCRQLEDECQRLQLELTRLGQLATLGTLTGGIAHDFNNLLTAIMAYAGLGRAEAAKPEVVDALDQILKATERARQLTRQILVFSRHREHTPLPVQLGAVVAEAVALLRPVVPPTVELQVDLVRDAGLVLADACQVHQIVLNLCSNAVHAMAPRGGRLTIELRRTETAKAGDAVPNDHAGAVCLSVVDTGQGMDAITRQRIFEPFFTTKPVGEGTGLGLANVEKIVREHHATIRVSSAPGQGTRFDVLFPLHTPPAG